MTNLNIFRRLNELETANLHLQVMLKSTRADIDSLKTIICRQTTQIAVLQTEAMPVPKPAAKPSPKPKTKAVRTKAALNSIRAKRSAYARAYYAKKKAERAAKDAA